MINNTTLVGRLSKNPELRYTGSGIAVTSFTMAVDRNYTNAQGERETDFINCVIWREQAENLANFAVKGSLIGITGNIQTRTYENNEGRTVYVTEVKADNFQMLEPKTVTDQRRNGQQQYNNQGNQPQNNQQNYNHQNQQQNRNQPNNQNSNPFENMNFDADPFESNIDATDINDDDLPF